MKNLKTYKFLGFFLYGCENKGDLEQFIDAYNSLDEAKSACQKHHKENGWYSYKIELL